jgi:hypothetical protein
MGRIKRSWPEVPHTPNKAPSLPSPASGEGREGAPVRTERLVRCYLSGSATKLASGQSSTPKAMLTTPPARSDGFDHKGGSERRTYSQGPTGGQGPRAARVAAPFRAPRALGRAGMIGFAALSVARGSTAHLYRAGILASPGAGFAHDPGRAPLWQAAWIERQEGQQKIRKGRNPGLELRPQRIRNDHGSRPAALGDRRRLTVLGGPDDSRQCCLGFREVEVLSWRPLRLQELL